MSDFLKLTVRTSYNEYDDTEDDQLLVRPGLEFMEIPKLSQLKQGKRTWAPSKKAKASHTYNTQLAPTPVASLSETGQLLISPGLEFIQFPRFDETNIDKRTWAPRKQKGANFRPVGK